MGTAGRFFSRWQDWLGVGIVGLFILVAIFAPLLSPVDPELPGPFKIIPGTIRQVPQPPSPEAPLGTLPDQASVYHALIWGARQVLIFGISITAVIFIIGTIIGTTSAYFGGWINTFLMWVTDSFLSFPVIAGVVLLKQLITITSYSLGIRIDRWGANFMIDQMIETELPTVSQTLLTFANLIQKIQPISLAFILFLWMPYARLMNASVSRLRQTDYVIAARASGVRNGRIMFKHLIPNAIAPVLVLAAKDIGGLVVLQTTFAFIGLGGQSPWAQVLVSGRDWIFSPKGIISYWWVFLPVTLALILFGIGWNIIGDGLNDALNPRVSRSNF